MNKGFTVFTNDPRNPKVRLVISGKVKGHIALSPTHIRFLGKEGQPLKRTVTIKPLNGHTFNIKDVATKEGRHLAYDLQPVGGDAAKNGYRLEVENTMQTAGNYRDLITIKTDSKKKPILRIPVSARIYAASKQPPTKRQ